MGESRKKKSLRNVITGLFSNVLIYILSLFTSKVIKENLGLQILGLNGVLSNVISILGLTEMGLSSIITFALYKPLAENNIPKIKSIMRFYKNAYRVIACVVLGIGLILFPFIPSFVKGGDFSKGYIYLVYSLFLINSVSSYFFSYNCTIIAADQKNYILTILGLISNYATKISQLLIVIFTSNYVLFLSAQIIITLIFNIIKYYLTRKLYPYLKEPAEKLDKETYNSIMNKIGALFISAIATKILTSTDNILVSMFCGVETVGKFTSYLSIVAMITSFINIVFYNMSSSIGNYLATETNENKYLLFKRFYYLNQALVSICSICLYFLLTPFISMWLGSDVVLSDIIILLMVFNFYIQNTRIIINIIRAGEGLFEQFKYFPLIESAINLIVSIVLGKIFGISGVIWGTIISFFIIPFWSIPLIIYQNIFHKSLLNYFKLFFINFTKCCILFFVVYFVTKKVNIVIPSNFGIFLIEAFIVFICVSLLWLLLSITSKEQKYFLDLVKQKFKRK